MPISSRRKAVEGGMRESVMMWSTSSISAILLKPLRPIGVSIASVAKWLGHANTTTTQQTYIHIIQELENKDTDKVLQHLSKLI